MRFTLLLLGAAFASLAVTAAAQPAPAPSPAPSTTPAVPATYVRIVEADLLPGERVSNATIAGSTGPVTNRVRAAVEYTFLGNNFVEFEYRRWKPRTATGASVTDQDVFVNSSIWGRSHTYLATSTFIHSSSDGSPVLHADLGFGVERLPDPTVPASLFFSYYDYPEVHGALGAAAGTTAYQRYKVQAYSFGGALALPRSPLYLTAGIAGDGYVVKQNAPSNAKHTSATVGIGVHL